VAAPWVISNKSHVIEKIKNKKETGASTQPAPV